MTLSTTRVCPDLLYYSEQFVMNSIANKDKIPFSSQFSIVYLGDNKTFIRLLFDESWPINFVSYRYLYRLETDLLSTPETIRRRMMVYPSSSQYYVADSDSTSVCNVNIFNLQEDDLNMLDRLLQYRCDSTSVTLIDIDYSLLNTNLSKLIYIYLDFKINENYSLFDNITLISNNDSVLESFFESFLIDSVFIYLSNKGI